MKYWGWLALKLTAAAAILPVIWLGIRAILPPPTFVQPMGRDLVHTLVALCFALACAGVLVLIILDQRYRCRSCARRLRMPLMRGSWDQMLLVGPPRIEYICIYGHVTLRVSEVQITGLQIPDSVPNRDIWTEFEQLEESRK